MVAIPESAHALLDSAALAHVVTLNADGSPHASCVWVGRDDGDVVFGSLGVYRKIRNLRRDPRVAVTIESDRVDANGLREYLALNGEATVVEGGGMELVRRLARTYLGPEAVYPPGPDSRPGFVVRIRPHKITGIGPWAAKSA